MPSVSGELQIVYHLARGTKLTLIDITIICPIKICQMIVEKMYMVMMNEVVSRMKIKMDITFFFTFWNIVPYDYLTCSLRNVHGNMRFFSPVLRMVPFLVGWEGLDL
jgi:hypothetical protein